MSDPQQMDTATIKRRVEILEAALECFLKFGFQKTSLDDIAKAAKLSRPLIYLQFKNKEEIFKATFFHLVGGGYETAKKVIESNLNKKEKLFNIYDALLIEPWKRISGKPMEKDFYNICDELIPEVSAKHEAFLQKCVVSVLGDKALSEVFTLSVSGLYSDVPTTAVLQKRIKLLIAQFIP